MSKEGFGNPSEKFMKEATPFKKALMGEDWDRAAELVDETTMRWELTEMVTSEMAYRAMIAAANLEQPDLAEQAARVILNENNEYSDWQKESAEGYLKKIGKFEEQPLSTEEMKNVLMEAYNDKKYDSLREKLTDDQLSEALMELLTDGQTYAVFSISKELNLQDQTLMAAKTILGVNKFNYAPSAREEAQAFVDTQ